MRVGLVRRGFSKTGGAESYLKRFAAALVEAGHDCILFGSPEWPSWNYGEFLPVAGRSPREFADSLRQIQLSADGPRCDYLFSLERVWGCDCFRAGDGVHRAWLERRARYEPGWKSLFRRFNRKHRELLEIESKLLSPDGAKTIIANSKLVKGEILQFTNYPSERIHVVYNGLPSELLAGDHPTLRAEARTELNLSEADYVVLFAGSGWERKGLKFAIEGFNQANLANSVLLVAGRGNPRSLGISGGNSDRVRFLGPVIGLKKVLAASDAFILPTLYDPFSNACLEALAMGLPVITTAANGMSEIIHSGSEGEVLDEPSDVSAIAQAIRNWSEKEKRDAARPHLIELAGNYSIESNLEQTLKVIQPG